MEKYLPQKSSSSVDIFILSNSSAKKIVVPKSDCPKVLVFLKKCRSKKVGTVKNCFEEKTLPKMELLKKSSCTEEIAATKK